MSRCRICGNEEGNRTYSVREMMFGTREVFDYFECGACGCLQIAAYPTNMEKYYPNDYWEFESKRMFEDKIIESFGLLVRSRRTRYWLSNELDLIGKLLTFGKSIPRHITWLRRAGINDLHAAVLDVGCGIGDRLQSLCSAGFTNLQGIDPFIKADIVYPNGVKVYKRSVFEFSGVYDYITLHHSFEHMPAPLDVLHKLRELLAPQGVLLLRIPVTATAWEDYGVNWVQIDAPRHFYLHTVNSLQRIADRAGLRIGRVEFDSNALQFWGSEQYRRDISLYDPRSYEFGLENSIFTREQIDDYAKRSRELNRWGRGDQACFYLRRAVQP